MSAAVLQSPLIVDQGTDAQTPFIYSDVNGVAIDLTGYSAEMQLRRNITDDAVALDLSTSNSGIAIDGPSGTVTPIFTNSQTDGLLGLYFFDLKLTSSGGLESRLIQGQYQFSAACTRSA